MRSNSSLSRLLSCHNPFYAISAVLVLYGVHTALRAPEGLPALTVLLSLAGYAVALGGAAVLVVRVARVWEDARTVLCLCVLLLAAASVVLDDLLLTDRTLGRGALLTGLGLAMALSESVLAGARLKLGILYRAPYHLLLAVFYLYPLLVVGLVDDFHPGNRTPLYLAIAGFPVVAGAAFLTLIPAIRRGAAYVARNGTPWSWPWYPWPAFVLLGVAAVARGYLLCVSLFPAPAGETPYAVFFLAPSAFAFSILLWERGLIAQPRIRAQLLQEEPVYEENVPLGWSLTLMGLAFFLATPGNPGTREQEALLTELMIAPSAAVWIAAAAVFLLSFARGHGRDAELPLTLSLLYGAVAGTSSLHLGEFRWLNPHPAPLGALAALQVVLLVRHPSIARGFGTLVFGLLALVAAFPGTWVTVGWGFVPWHLALAGCLALAALCDDEDRDFFVLLSCLLLLGLFVGQGLFGRGILLELGLSPSIVLRAAHLAILASITVLAAWRFDSHWLRRVAWGQGALAGAKVVHLSSSLDLPPGSIALLCGMLALVVGVLFSLTKARLHPPEAKLEG